MYPNSFLEYLKAAQANKEPPPRAKVPQWPGLGDEGWQDYVERFNYQQQNQFEDRTNPMTQLIRLMGAYGRMNRGQ